ncbi:CgeB family protein [Geoalkalibacter halelectricus]|uniref:CgeB family protein n=1 Tax=Geoalkalibacter halelectricus TaxID=2847045 RepID=UPI003D263A23
MAKLDYSGLTEGICRAFQKKGFVTQIFDTKKYRKIDKYIKKDFSFKKFQIFLQEFSPDIVFLVAPLFLKKEYYEIIKNYKKRKDCKTIGWIGDSFENITENEERLSIFDFLYYTDTGFFKIHTASNVEYLPLATDEQIFYFENSEGRKRYNCSFVASQTKERSSFLKLIKNKVNILGPGWVRGDDLNKLHSVNRCKLSIGKVAKIYSQSEIVLNLKNENNVIDGLNQRSFDPCAAGSVLVHDYVKDIELNYEIGEEVLVFRSAEEFDNLYEMLIKDSNFKKKISKNGQKRVLSCHTFEKRADKIISDIKSL